MTNYGFNPSWNNEQRRLALIERCWDPATTERLAAAGVGPGWKCLEVGAGNGSIARWLRGRVGAAGEVVAFDLDTRFFAEEPGIEARQGDILSDDLEPDAYDLVHCRALLHHLPGRQHEALHRMVSALRPSGVLVATEPWLGAMWASPTDAYARASKAVDEAIPADYGWAVGLAQAFRDAGLVDIRADAASDVVQGATALAELVALTIEAVRPLVPIYVDIDSAIKLLEDPDTIEPGPVWYSATGTRPSA